jgi:hypothetical protein
MGIGNTIGAILFVDSCQLIVQFFAGGCEDRTSAREAEEYPVLEAVARERMLKTGKRLSGCCGDL